MKRIILLILLSTLYLQAKSITLNDKDKENLKTNPNKKAVYLRLLKYLELKRKIKDFSLEKKLNYVNSFYNKILPVNDSTKYSADDYWATPKEFIIEGKGDCEDYAIAKYFTLQEVGIPKEKLFLAVVKVKVQQTTIWC
ncbi:MAG: transglutaminase-like cysteine peptidase [Halarcobacter ebronensis]